MAIIDRNLKDGDVLLATFKGKVYTCRVHSNKDDGMTFTVDGDKMAYATISGAGKSIHGSRSIGGYGFWTREGDAPPIKKIVAKTAKASKAIVPFDPTRGWCIACCDAFPLNADGTLPKKCPAGHTSAPMGDALSTGKKPSLRMVTLAEMKRIEKDEKAKASAKRATKPVKAAPAKKATKAPAKKAKVA